MLKVQCMSGNIHVDGAGMLPVTLRRTNTNPAFADKFNILFSVKTEYLYVQPNAWRDVHLLLQST